MRVEEFLQTMNTTIERYALGIKIFIASVAVLIAYNYFYYPSLLLLGVGVPVYLYFRVYRRELVNQVVVNTPLPEPVTAPASPTVETIATIATSAP
jgi:hypothetical protein